MNKKRIVLVLAIIFLLLISVLIVYLINSNKTITCELSKDNYSTVIYIDNDNFINFDYKYSFDTIEDSVNKYDMMISYIDFISKIDGIDANINQNKNEMEYSINVDINKVSKDDYKLLEIDKVIDLSNSEIKKYYEDLGYSCK